MSTFKKIEKYAMAKKFIIALIIILVVSDTVIAFVNPRYPMSSSSLIGLGFASYALMKEYENCQIEQKEVSKAILILSIVLAGFSLYYIALNVFNISGGLA